MCQIPICINILDISNPSDIKDRTRCFKVAFPQVSIHHQCTAVYVRISQLTDADRLVQINVLLYGVGDMNLTDYDTQALKIKTSGDKYWQPSYKMEIIQRYMQTRQYILHQCHQMLSLVQWVLLCKDSFHLFKELGIDYLGRPVLHLNVRKEVPSKIWCLILRDTRSIEKQFLLKREFGSG